MSRARGTPFAVGLGVVSAAFFAVTFVLNRAMAVAQGHPAWTASLRFLLMVPLLAVLLAARRQGPALVRAWRAAPMAWVTWGTVGFVVFYVPLVVAAAWVPAWVVAGTWPLTILAGVLLAPLLYTDARRRIPGRALASSLGIVAGVAVLQAAHAGASSPRVALAGAALVAVAAVAYPLGNRGAMLAMERAGLAVDPLVRVTAMTLGSLPAWLAVAAYGRAAAGWPPAEQVMQAGVVALCSGVVATTLFFAATDRVGASPAGLAAVEATQAAEVPFALALEVALLGAPWPGPAGLLGLGVIVAGLLVHARLASSAPSAADAPRPATE